MRLTDDLPPPGPRVTVQTSIPRLAADAIDLPSIKFAAREAGIADASLEHSTYRTSAGRVRITTDLRVAAFIVNRLREVAARPLDDRRDSAERTMACADAVGAMLAAMDQGIASSTAPMSSWFPKNPPTRDA